MVVILTLAGIISMLAGFGLISGLGGNKNYPDLGWLLVLAGIVMLLVYYVEFDNPPQNGNLPGISQSINR